jgi:hypothetical protein
MASSDMPCSEDLGWFTSDKHSRGWFEWLFLRASNFVGHFDSFLVFCAGAAGGRDETGEWSDLSIDRGSA